MRKSLMLKQKKSKKKKKKNRKNKKEKYKKNKKYQKSRNIWKHFLIYNGLYIHFLK